MDNLQKAESIVGIVGSVLFLAFLAAVYVKINRKLGEVEPE